MANANENIVNYKYDNSELVEVSVNNNNNIISFSKGGSGSGSGTFDSKTITTNGTYIASNEGLDGYDEVTVNLPNSNFQEKSVNVTASAVLNPDSGYNGISKATITVPSEISSLSRASVITCTYVLSSWTPSRIYSSSKMIPSAFTV